MPQTYTPWAWSPSHGRHYMYLLADDGTTILETLWSGPGQQSHVNSALPNPPSQVNSYNTPRTGVERQVSLPHTTISPESRTDRRYTATGPSSSPKQESYVLQNAGSYGTSNSTSRPYTQSMATGDTRAGFQDTRSEQASRYGSSPSYGGSSYASTSRQPVSNAPVLSKTSSNIRQASATSPSQASRQPVAALPLDVQSHISGLERRYLQTDPDQNQPHEQLDPRYRRVIPKHQPAFFVLGRVFKMLWTEPAGNANPGKTRNSTHFSVVWCNEQAYSEIRRFVVVRYKGSFSQCIPIQTYKRQGTTKPGLIMKDHGVIHTTPQAPNLLPGEHLTKFSIQVQPSSEFEHLEPESRVNYGKAYAVEHNVKVLDVGMVLPNHRYLIEQYFDSAMRGQ